MTRGEGKGQRITGSSRLSLFSALQNLVFQLLGPVEVLLIAFLAEFTDPREKVVDILGPVGVVGGRSHGWGKGRTLQPD